MTDDQARAYLVRVIRQALAGARHGLLSCGFDPHRAEAMDQSVTDDVVDQVLRAVGVSPAGPKSDHPWAKRWTLNGSAKGRRA